MVYQIIPIIYIYIHDISVGFHPLYDLNNQWPFFYMENQQKTSHQPNQWTSTPRKSWILSHLFEKTNLNWYRIDRSCLENIYLSFKDQRMESRPFFQIWKSPNRFFQIRNVARFSLLSNCAFWKEPLTFFGLGLLSEQLEMNWKKDPKESISKFKSEIGGLRFHHFIRFAKMFLQFSKLISGVLHGYKHQKIIENLESTTEVLFWKPRKYHWSSFLRVSLIYGTFYRCDPWRWFHVHHSTGVTIGHQPKQGTMKQKYLKLAIDLHCLISHMVIQWPMFQWPQR